MKTVIVLFSLAIFVIAVPTLPRGNFDNINAGLDNLLESKTREKKSPLQDTPQELPVENGQENQQLCNSKKSQLESSLLDKKNLGVRKPIIIKKKLGYHVYQDSDEEMAHADPNENCRNQVKVKLCDADPVLHTHSNNIKSITSEGSQGIISEKEMENSIRMAKEAVENLQRDLRKMEHTSKENLESNTELKHDIENTRRALDHIQHNIGNFESIDFQFNGPKQEGTEMKPKDLERLNQWKEAIENIHKNFEIAKNIEDAFQLDTHKTLPSENKKEIMKENENLTEEENFIKPESETRTNAREDSLQNIMSHKKTSQEDDKIDHHQNLEFEKTSNAPKENEDNDMFVSPTDHEESKIKLHSDSLTSEIFDNTFLGRDETKAMDEHTDDHLSIMKSSENSPKDLALETDKMITNNKSDLELKAVSDITMLPLQHKVDNNNDDKSLHKSLSSAKSYELKETPLDSTLLIDQNTNEEHSHNSLMKSAVINEGQIDSELKHLMSEKEASETKLDTHETKTTQWNKETTNENFLNMRASDDTMTLKEEEEKKKENPLHSSMFDNQNSVNVKSDLFKNVNEQHDLTEINDKQDSYPNLKEKQPNPNEFSSIRTNENENIEVINMENPKATNSQLKHLTQKELIPASKSVPNFQNEQLVSNKNDESISGQHFLKEEINARTNKSPDEKLNEEHELLESFLSRLAQDKQLKDNLSQFKSMSSPTMNKIILPMNTNEFTSEQHMINDPTNLRMGENHDTVQHLHESHGLHEAFSFVPERRPIDHSMHFKSFDLHNEDLMPSNGFKERQIGLSRQNLKMQLVEGKKYDDLAESQNENNPHLMHWTQEKQNNDHFSLNDHLMQAQTKKNEHSLSDMNMRMTEEQNSGQHFIDSHEVYDPLSMRWADDHQHSNQMEPFENTAEFYNEPHYHHMNDHLHEHTSGSRFNNHFDIDGGHNFAPMRSRMHSQSNILKLANPSDIDNAMQPSMHIGLRDNSMQWGHHHHGMARTSFPSSVPMNAGTPDAVGVFPNANTGCGIPLLLSCSPSIVSGTMAKAHPMAGSTPSFRSGDDLMYYMKRDINNFHGVPSIKTKKSVISLNHKTS